MPTRLAIHKILDGFEKFRVGICVQHKTTCSTCVSCCRRLRQCQLTPPSGGRSYVLSSVQRWTGASTCYEARARCTLRRLRLVPLPDCLRFSGTIPLHAGPVLSSFPRYDPALW